MNDEKIIQKLLEHDDHFEKLEDKIEDFRREFLQGQDEMMTILKRLDDERVFTIEWVRRIETEVKEQKLRTEEHEKLLQKIKLELKLSS